MPSIGAFLSYLFITAFTPGPNTIMAMTTAARFGFKKSTGFFFGVTTGFFILLVLSSFFSVVLYHLIPTIKPIMTIIGALYILWLAWKVFKSKPPQIEKESNSNGNNMFWTGFFLQFMNPKAILFALTCFSTFIVPYYKDPLILAGFVFGISVFPLASTTSWGLFGSAFQKTLSKHYKVINTIMALLLVFCAVSLFI